MAAPSGKANAAFVKVKYLRYLTYLAYRGMHYLP
jgi:hypothetical protein